MKLKSLSGFLIGVSTGAAIMLLFAPKSGKNTRRYIGRKVVEGREFIEDGTDKIHDMGVDLRDKGKHAIKRANTAFAAAVDAGKSMASAIL